MQNGTFRNASLFFLAGATLAGGAALLLAPQSGERTRRAIRRKAEDAADFLTETGNKAGRQFQGVRKGITQAWSRTRLAA
jgi:gas vesicle protein